MGNFAKTISLLLAGSFLISASFFRIPDSGRATLTDCAEDFSNRAMQEDCVNCAQFLRRRETYREETALFMLRSKTGKKEYDVTVRYEKEKNGEEREVGRSWVDLETDLLDFCKNNAKDAVDARLFFDGKKFTYTPEQNGVYCDYARSLDLALAALREGKNGSEVVQAEFIPRITVKMLRERTQRLGAFTTYFDGGNLPRAHNIALAATRIAGVELAPKSEFSFNAVVGKRTEANGFEVANVIFEGEFVPGVGGGVCQASTTLMNAALGSGLKITESRPHSLPVGYVKPSLDAMVSEYSDLKFINPYDFPVYLAAETGGNFVRFIVYGKPDGRRYVTESNVRYRITPPAAEIVEGEEDKVLRAEKEGVASESFLLVYDRAGNLLSRKLFRRDTYGASQGKIMVKKTEQDDAPEQNGNAEPPQEPAQ